LLLFSWFSLQNFKRWLSAKYCMLAPRTWWDHTSQRIRMASLYSLLKHFIGVNKVDSVIGTCTFKGQKVALKSSIVEPIQVTGASRATCHRYQMVLKNSFSNRLHSCRKALINLIISRRWTSLQEWGI
jgi:hypothetical protein